MTYDMHVQFFTVAIFSLDILAECPISIGFRTLEIFVVRANS